jgi:predicted nucleic acid-binding protein
MTFANIPAGETIFVDANVLIYHFTSDLKYGAACTQLIKQVELQQLRGLTSAHVLADVAHRLMTLEAMQRLGWPQTGLAVRLRRHHAEIPKLTVFRQAIADLPHLRIQVLPLTQVMVESATLLSQRYELLTDDAVIVAMMQQHGITSLASEDADFDRVPGLTRYAPA